jgi:enamine deaminase RidA (YjgF/YER057c/UK114 family)
MGRAPVSPCTRAGQMVFVSGMPPFDPETGEIAVHAPFERQAELVLEQMKTALEAAGSDLDHVLKCNVLCISAERFKVFNEIHKRYFPKKPAGADLFLRAGVDGALRHRDRLRRRHQELTVYRRVGLCGRRVATIDLQPSAHRAAPTRSSNCQ